MKKIILLFLFIFSFYFIVSIGVVNSLEVPNDAIRIRVVPNSNSDYDQKVKSKVRDRLETSLYNLLKDASSVSEARDIVNKNLSFIDSEVDSVLSNEKYDYKVNFGYNYFPLKEYKGVKYDAGYYESLLITLGEGKGDNWWCVLFPPLCLIEAEDTTDVEYKSFVKEILDKYL